MASVGGPRRMGTAGALAGVALVFLAVAGAVVIWVEFATAQRADRVKLVLEPPAATAVSLAQPAEDSVRLAAPGESPLPGAAPNEDVGETAPPEAVIPPEPAPDETAPAPAPEQELSRLTAAVPSVENEAVEDAGETAPPEAVIPPDPAPDDAVPDEAVPGEAAPEPAPEQELSRLTAPVPSAETAPPDGDAPAP